MGANCEPLLAKGSSDEYEQCTDDLLKQKDAETWRNSILKAHELLIVDDENFSRISVLRLLKNLGDPETDSATNGVEALSHP